MGAGAMTPKRRAALEKLASSPGGIASLPRHLGDALVEAGFASRVFYAVGGGWKDGDRAGEKMFEMTRKGSGALQ